MILADTSVWIEFLRGTRRGARLSDLLASDEAVTHPFVIGEIALGELGPRRRALLRDFGALRALETARDDDVLALVQAHSLAGTGIGWVDAHLLASAHAAHVGIWTFDRRLAGAARRVGIALDGSE